MGYLFIGVFKMRLSQNFLLSEFLVSATAKEKNIPNIPTVAEIDSMIQLCKSCLEPLRSWARENYNSRAIINITSGYRSPQLNTIIRGSATSQHCRGEAADFTITGISNELLFAYITLFSNISYDQCIYEFGSWIHLSYTVKRENKKINSIAIINADGKIEIQHFTQQQLLNNLCQLPK